jgi:hypothetical protein
VPSPSTKYITMLKGWSQVARAWWENDAAKTRARSIQWVMEKQGTQRTWRQSIRAPGDAEASWQENGARVVLKKGAPGNFLLFHWVYFVTCVVHCAKA